MTTPSECARAAAASHHRIDAPLAPARAAKVIALDPAAWGVARRVGAGPWAAARFYTCGGPAPGGPGTLPLTGADGTSAVLAGVLDGTDVVIVLATADSGRAAAAAIGRECGARAVTTAGVVLGDGLEADDAVAALRPYARVLLLSADEADVTELLTALRV